VPTYFEELIAEGVPDKLPADGFTFEDVFDEHIANNQKTWKQSRDLTVGASECFGCIRKTFFGKRGTEFGIEPDADYEESWGAMERGNIIENSYIVPAIEVGLKRRGLELIMAGDGQDTLIEGIHSATLDGLIIPADPAIGKFLPRDFLAYYGIDDIGEQDSIVLEMKSFDPRLALTHEKAQHHGQVQMQMGMIRENTEYKPKLAVLIYVNASWLDDIRIFVIEYDDSMYRIGRERNDKVFGVDDAGLFAPEGKVDGMCQYCKFQGACNDVQAKRVPNARKALTKKEIDDQDKELLDELRPFVLKRDDVKQQIKELETSLEEYNEAIRQELIKHGTSRAVADDFKATYTFQKGRKALSKAKIEEAGLDPEDFMEEGNGFEKLTVTVSNPDAR
jgi:hypothetical protein